MTETLKDIVSQVKELEKELKKPKETVWGTLAARSNFNQEGI